MDVLDWIDRIEVVNNHLPRLEKDAEEMNDRELTRKVIGKNLPESWQGDWILKQRDKLTKIEDAKDVLGIIEKASFLDEKPEPPKKDRRTTVDKMETSSTGGQQCRLKDHNHLWSECPNNSYRSNYKKTHYTTIRENERARNKDTRPKSGDTTMNPHSTSREEESNSIECSQQKGAPVVTFDNTEEIISDDESLDSRILRGKDVF